MKKPLKIFAFLIAMIIAVSCFAGALTVNAEAQKTYKLFDLYKEKKVKIIGRSQTDYNGTMCEWAGNGIEFNAKTNGAAIRISLTTNEKIYFAAYVDGVYQDRNSSVTKDNPYFFVNCPEGEHNIKILRDTEHGNSKNHITKLVSISTDGELLDPPKDNDFLIEAIVSTTGLGKGVLGTYAPNTAWKTPGEHSFVNAYAYLLAEKAGADLSCIGIGGQRVQDATEEEMNKSRLNTPAKVLYEYTNGYCDIVANENKWEPTRKPNLILMELGEFDTKANDDFKGSMIDLINYLREKNGKDVPLVWVGGPEDKYAVMKEILTGDLAADKNLYAFHHSYGISGAASSVTSEEGRPNVAEQKVFAESLFKFLREKNLVPDKAAESSGFALGNTTIIIIACAAAVVVAVVVILIIVLKKRKKSE